MKLVASTGREDLATVYIAEMTNGRLIEFVESVEPPFTKEQKQVFIVSTMYGCPVKCKICDAGESYFGKLTANEILEQINFLVEKNYTNKIITTDKLKIQFARMGEPALNSAVLDVLGKLPELYRFKRLIPSVSTIAPTGCEQFLHWLKIIKDVFYKENFQLQFSLHSTDEQQRNELIPVKKMTLEQIAEYGTDFFKPGERKVTLNFAVSEDSIIEPVVLKKFFSPEVFFIKLTPVNPTFKSKTNDIKSYFNQGNKDTVLTESLRREGYEVLLSYGQSEENLIGSNCGQHILNFISSGKKSDESYTYKIEHY